MCTYQERSFYQAGLQHVPGKLFGPWQAILAIQDVDAGYVTIYGGGAQSVRGPEHEWQIAEG